MEVSVTRGLKELKLIDSKINRSISEYPFVGYAKKSSKKVNNTYSREDFTEYLKGNYDRVNALMNNRVQIKTAINASNAITYVTVCDRSMNVTEALDEKSRLPYKKAFLAKLEKDLKSAKSYIDNENEKVEDKIFLLIKDSGNESNSTSSKKDSSQDNSKEMFYNSYREEQFYEMINPNKVEEIIESLKNEIEEFENEIDFVLSESNAITKIIIPD